VAEFTITGGKEIQAVLQEMPVKFRRKALVHAFRQGAKIVLQDAKRRAPNDTIKTALTIARGNRRTRPTKDTVLMIALKRPASRLAHLFEFGTRERFKKSGSPSGRMIAHPFMRPALDANAQQAISVIARITKENITLIAKQLTAGQKVSLAKKNRVL